MHIGNKTLKWCLFQIHKSHMKTPIPRRAMITAMAEYYVSDIPSLYG